MKGKHSEIVSLTKATAPEQYKHRAGLKSEESKPKIEKKRKVAAPEEEQKEPKKAKRAKPEVAPSPGEWSCSSNPILHGSLMDYKVHILSNKQLGSLARERPPHQKVKASGKPVSSESEDKDNAPVPPSSSSAESDGEDDLAKLVHESAANGGKPKSTHGKTKHFPSEETPEQRDARTIFVGNVPVEVVKSRVCTQEAIFNIRSF